MNEPKQAMHTPPFRFRVDDRSPGHTTFSVFVGEEGQGGNSGWLTLRNDEYDVLAPLLLAAPKLLSALESVAVVAEHYLPKDDFDGPSAAHEALHDAWTTLHDARDLIERVRGGQA